MGSPRRGARSLASGHGGCVALGPATGESCAPYPPREPRTRRRTVVTRSRRPVGCDPHQRPAPLHPRPNPNFRKPPEMGRTRTGFSAANLRTSSVTLVRNPASVTLANAGVYADRKVPNMRCFGGCFLAGARREAGDEAILGRLGSGGPRGRPLMWARPVGERASLASGHGGGVALGPVTMESCAPYPPREPRTRRRTVVTRSRRPSGCDPHQRPAPLRSRPNPNFRKRPEMDRTRTGFSPGAGPFCCATKQPRPTTITPDRSRPSDPTSATGPARQALHPRRGEPASRRPALLQ